MSRARRAFFAVAALAGGLRAESVPQELIPLPLTNGAQTEQMLGAAAGAMQLSTAALTLGKRRVVASVTFVSGEGRFVTKASEVPKLGRCRLTRGGERSWAVRELRRDKTMDLVLGEVVGDEEGLPEIEPVRWTPGAALTLGTWLVAPSLEIDEGRWQVRDQPLRLGVMSAQTRAIESQGSALGIQMEVVDGRVVVTSVVDDSPAQKAGLREQDVLLAINGTEVGQREEVIDLVTAKQPGDEVVVRLQRRGKDLTKNVQVASRSRMLANLYGDDYANGGVSIRTDGFDQVLQHDLPLNPVDMGGPLFNLAGEAVGINIARADRITTYALPTEAFRVKLEKWLEGLR